ncbi:FecR domain-containing protein [Cytophagaceae bacterium YF14B1]|uniref:FecR domain-containing protein n=1 Tax=Xanthocytophaga flava TaxID=3048013 RepID=A0AAE3QLC4_9BACT|nr:FecR domain-containing protein [Xanthocytophaga flavus]MDJ1479533.1 FecR domain-containing protein [Xanthocytophaga flavus]
MNYQNYTSQDFILDDYFIEWVLKPNVATNLYWQNWLSEHPEKQKDVNEARSFLLQMKFTRYELPPNEYEKEGLQLQNDIEEFERRRSLSLGRSVKRYWIGIAASIALCLVVIASLYLKNTYTKITIQTPYGQIRKVTLTDQSVVTLNANSILTYTKDWNGSSDREVWLQGEAFFEVTKKDKKQRFIVHTQALDVQVVGTRFNVSDRKENTQVVLNEGKVLLNRHTVLSDTVIPMQVGDLIEFSERSKNFRKKNVRPDVYSSWKNHEWILEEMSLREVAFKIEDTYGVKVIIKDPAIARQVVTGVVPTESLDVLLDALEAAFNIRIIHKSNQIFIQA